MVPVPNRFVVSPFFLGERMSALAGVVGDDARVNDPGEAGDAAAVRAAVHRGLADTVRSCLEAGERPVSLAGDCCTTLGILAGLERAGCEPSLLWFDAHGDFNTPETSPSGFLGGMPLAILVGRCGEALRDEVGLDPLPEGRVVLTDARDLDPLERQALEASRVTHHPRVEDLLSHPLPEGPLWVHFDADVVDASESPAHRYPAPDGPSVETLRAAFRRIAATGRLAAVSVSAWDPELDTDGVSRRVTLDLLDELVGPARGGQSR